MERYDGYVAQFRGAYDWYTGPAMLPLPGFVWMAPIVKARVPPHSSHDDTLLKSS